MIQGGQAGQGVLALINFSKEMTGIMISRIKKANAACCLRVIDVIKTADTQKHGVDWILGVLSFINRNAKLLGRKSS